MGKFQNRYRTTSWRAQWWDYGSKAAYFITICTKNREHFFGEISANKMHLSPIGMLAQNFWHEIKHHCKNVELDAFQVMPNHIHGILVLRPPSADSVEARHALPLPNPGSQRFQNPGKNTISSIIGSYKSAVTKHANRLGLPFAWQSNYYDIIIRDEMAYAMISDYIKSNVCNWKEDRFCKRK